MSTTTTTTVLGTTTTATTRYDETMTLRLLTMLIETVFTNDNESLRSSCDAIRKFNEDLFKDVTNLLKKTTDIDIETRLEGDNGDSSTTIAKLVRSFYEVYLFKSAEDYSVDNDGDNSKASELFQIRQRIASEIDTDHTGTASKAITVIDTFCRRFSYVECLETLLEMVSVDSRVFVHRLNSRAA